MLGFEWWGGGAGCWVLIGGVEGRGFEWWVWRMSRVC